MDVMTDLYLILVDMISTNPVLSLFLIGFFMSFGVFFSVPFATPLYMIAVQNIEMPIFLIAAISSVGAMLGEIFSYYFGILANYVYIKIKGKKIEDKKDEKKNPLIEWLERTSEEYALEAVFIFAATPLPDDLLMLYFGMRRVPLVKLFIAGTLGKLILMFYEAYAIKIGVDVLEDIFNVPEEVIFITLIVAMPIFVYLSYLMSKRIDSEKTIPFIIKFKNFVDRIKRALGIKKEEKDEEEGKEKEKEGQSVEGKEESKPADSPPP
ncbi:MAG: VTT domain-containing protein [Candidatus Asgardarchaeia archaeon]